MPEAGPRGRRATFAERRERRAAIDDPAIVLEAAARFLEVRARSVTEVRRRLTSAGYRPELVEAAIERLTELGLLDDVAFGRAWIESRERARPRGERAIRQELVDKGLDRELVGRLLEERRAAFEPSDDGEHASATSPDEAAAERLLARNRRSLDRVADPRQRRQRAYALLARHGFSPDICRTLSATVLADTVDEDPDVDLG